MEMIGAATTREKASSSQVVVHIRVLTVIVDVSLQVLSFDEALDSLFDSSVIGAEVSELVQHLGYEDGVRQALARLHHARAW